VQNGEKNILWSTVWHDKARKISAHMEKPMNRKYFPQFATHRGAAYAFFLIWNCALAGIVPAAHGQAATAPASTHAKEYTQGEQNARKIANEWLARGIPGVTLAVAVDGRTVYAEGFGYADLEQRVPVWPGTKFRIASDSKPLTAAGLMLLVEQGKFDLDAPVQKYLPSFPDKGAKITARMLAGHLAGIRHYKDDEFLISRHYDSVLEGLKIFENDPLVSPPGKEFHYSSYGFNLLSAVIESAAGEDFLSYMHERVFGPLGLRHTIEDQTTEIIEQRARPYRKLPDGTAKNAPFVDNSYKWEGGGFLSTAEDLAKFGSALLQPGFLKQESLRLLFTSQKTWDGKETDYGIGWSVGTSKSGQKVYAHNGGAAGGSSRLILYPDARVVVAMIRNFEGEGGWRDEEVEAVGEAFEKK
jgi:serine beta-lactamase-like protein LACTB, mitochondrial